ncbi:PRC-barrel domain-containing protein [Falsibacillus albus]|uniref:Photosystem reaction center subunit H n=1 Tax=Falsibacillus albus TaxID=2478915 RepID=A0A3L7K4V2_9BACI|nr:PRC-barrel domain-containing protein [Falsibacillus albus]RLQ98116.1 photosystem reaction center subunit H [Falsibacillus albus]
MRTFSLLNGLSVFEQTGGIVGTVCDVIITGEGNVTAMFVKGRGLIAKKYRLPIDCILAFGPDGLMIESPDDLQKLDFRLNEYTLSHHQALIGKRTLTTEGECLGDLEDVYFQEALGTIVGYELTDGFFADITKGKRVVSTTCPPMIGKDAIIVSLDQMRGGLPYDEMPKLPEQGYRKDRH